MPKIAILETGDYHEGPDTVRVFASAKKAIENIPAGFKKLDSFSKYYYEDKANAKWLNIREYEVEN